ncbi:MAG: hypothetical protein EXR69_12130 [Myxococcales bacterium]|nr:hypothetical protein [Myxococcales bacterium]
MASAAALVAALLTARAAAWDVLGPNAAPTGAEIDPAAHFGSTGALSSGWASPRVRTDPGALATVASATLAYLRAMKATDPAAGPGMFAELGVSQERMEATLERVIATAAADPDRLSDPDWLRSSFDIYTWTPDPAEPRVKKWKLQPGEIRVTRYLTTQTEGTATPDGTHTQALYGDPGEPWRSMYTRAQVMAGAYQTGPASAAARPLVWLTEDAVHDAIMQGSTAVRHPDGSVHTYGVDVSNGIAYVASHARRAQDRYWYFRERPHGPNGWGPPGSPEIALKAGVSVAGDVYNLGLGRLILLEYPEGAGTTLRLVVLADSGGAFQPNLCQLDLYGGAFPSHDALYAAWRSVPEHLRASVLVARE